MVIETNRLSSSSPPPVVLRPYVSASSRIARKIHNEQFKKPLESNNVAPNFGLKSTLRIVKKSLPHPSSPSEIASSCEDTSDLLELKSLILEFEKKLSDAKVQKANMVTQEQFEELLDQFETIVGELEVARLESARYKREAGILTRALSEDRRDCSPTSLEKQRAEMIERKKLRDEIERLRIIEIEYNSLKTQFEINQKRQVETRNCELELIDERVMVDRLMHEKTVVENRLDTVLEDNKNLKNQLETVTGELIEARKNLNDDRDQHCDQISQLTITNNSLQKAIGEFQITESRWKSKISELEKLLQESKIREEKSQSDLIALRSNLTGLDDEVRNLASSLAAETGANENLQSRLDRVESELKKSQSEIVSLRRRDKDLSTEISTLESTVGENERLKSELAKAKNELAEKDLKLSEISNSRELIKRTMGGEIERLNVQLEFTTSRSSALVDKYEKLVREKDKMKSLLAHDTIARMNRASSSSSTSSFRHN